MMKEEEDFVLPTPPVKEMPTLAGFMKWCTERQYNMYSAIFEKKKGQYYQEYLATFKKYDR